MEQYKINEIINKTYRQNLERLDKNKQKEPISQNNAYKNAVMQFVNQFQATIHGDVNQFSNAIITLKNGTQFKIINKKIINAHQY